jgi:hypothetical protein
LYWSSANWHVIRVTVKGLTSDPYLMYCCIKATMLNYCNTTDYLYEHISYLDTNLLYSFK